jgi:predicted dehydrogenase
LKIGIIGCGKRFTNVYFQIIKSLGHEIFLWNRTSQKSIKFCEENNCHLVNELKDFSNIQPDLLLCFVPPTSQLDILKKLTNLNCKVLLETPALDSQIIALNNVGVLEQWPYLPLEQFKELIYSKNLMHRPYIIFNDGRSFDYHAIAQLRTYAKYPIPVISKGTIKNHNNPGIIDSSGNLNNTPHEWTIGQLDMSDGSILMYSFAYNCKSLSTIPIQFLRAYSSNGSIVTGRMKEIGNDYEFIDVRYVDSASQKPIICSVLVEKNEKTIFSIKIEEKNIEWKNPFAHLGFDDQQTAIATVIENGLKGICYSFRDAYIDCACINAIKQSGYSQQVIKLL